MVTGIIIAAAVVGILGILIGIFPVSYTHLDVYKRQVNGTRGRCHHGPGTGGNH